MNAYRKPRLLFVLTLVSLIFAWQAVSPAIVLAGDGTPHEAPDDFKIIEPPPGCVVFYDVLVFCSLYTSSMFRVFEERHFPFNFLLTYKS